MEIVIGFGLGLGFAIIIFLLTSQSFWKAIAPSQQKSFSSEKFIKIDENYFTGDETIIDTRKRRNEAMKRLEKFKARNRFYA